MPDLRIYGGEEWRNPCIVPVFIYKDGAWRHITQGTKFYYDGEWHTINCGYTSEFIEDTFECEEADIEYTSEWIEDTFECEEE